MSTVGKLGREVRSLGDTTPGEWFQEVFGVNTPWELLVSNSLQVITVGIIGWLVATWFERRHLRLMTQREIPLHQISLNTLKHTPNCEAEACTLLIGSVVVAHDYFRTLIIFIRKLIGGNIKPYERLVQRGRREALIRLREEADLRAIDKIINVRFTTTAISGRFLHAVEMVAYGTGISTNSRQ